MWARGRGDKDPTCSSEGRGSPELERGQGRGSGLLRTEVTRRSDSGGKYHPDSLRRGVTVRSRDRPGRGARARGPGCSDVGPGASGRGPPADQRGEVGLASSVEGRQAPSSGGRNPCLHRTSPCGDIRLPPPRGGRHTVGGLGPPASRRGPRGLRLRGQGADRVHRQEASTCLVVGVVSVSVSRSRCISVRVCVSVSTSASTCLGLRLSAIVTAVGIDRHLQLHQ